MRRWVGYSVAIPAADFGLEPPLAVLLVRLKKARLYRHLICRLWPFSVVSISYFYDIHLTTYETSLFLGRLMKAALFICRR